MKTMGVSSFSSARMIFVTAIMLQAFNFAQAAVSKTAPVSAAVIAPAKTNPSSSATTKAGKSNAAKSVKKTEPAKQSKIEASEILRNARAEYAKTNYAGAVRLYLSLPKRSKEYVRSQEELAWAYLMNGDWVSLRGLLPHLNSSLVPMEYRLEGQVLSSISSLHQCKYEQVQKSISDFQKDMRPLVKAIEVQLQQSAKVKNKEAAKEIAVKLQNRKALVAEAITKMRFIKLELLSQVQRYERFKNKEEVLSKSSQLASASGSREDEVIDKAEKSKLVFRSEGDYWPDELFLLKSLSDSDCEQFKKFDKAVSKDESSTGGA